MNCCLTVSALKLWCVQTCLLFVVDHVSEAWHWQFPCSWASFATFIMSKSSRIVPFHSNNSWIALESIPSSQGRTKVLFQSHQQQRHFLFLFVSIGGRKWEKERLLAKWPATTITQNKWACLPPQKHLFGNMVPLACLHTLKEHHHPSKWPVILSNSWGGSIFAKYTNPS